jgi:signal transduction histidine kinase
MDPFIDEPRSALDTARDVAALAMLSATFADGHPLQVAEALGDLLITTLRLDFTYLTVRDDGVGFDPQTARQGAGQGRNFGLAGIQERAVLLGGRCDIGSQPGHGTTIHICLPASRPPSAPIQNEWNQQ